jgi:hypothetical protein
MSYPGKLLEGGRWLSLCRSETIVDQGRKDTIACRSAYDLVSKNLLISLKHRRNYEKIKANTIRKK